ncbi:DEAD/DEAH box helicase [Mycobacterium mantenii]|uniref:DEAD/DEAH box helicase n=1 Tax=Mycobacterium mantenii TaxID=560555 RepID=A0A1X0G0G2_MYCNT|nr:DEAD/DEAH box helicase [Mycobacterium mantenii]MCV7244743.1 DEAD/DEAH box helicase [Mycobacterium mantenii]ORB07512.1 DEAD/DEAH box helicase [Mycobacterium mantenii]BBY36831.1 DEAD/DEAH box helicase [Mycobacterium mantenii]
MNSSIDAVETSESIKGTYRRYLSSLLAVRDPKIDAALRGAIDNTEMLDRGPYLEATPPYAPGKSIQDLISEGVITQEFSELTSMALPLDRPLYVHQEQAIRRVADGRNIVVATGTGSGKTESFLIPILDSLVRERERGELGLGVRALLLYPMNALANDQMKRLRQLLAEYPAITFGRYTGETETDPRRARELFSELNIDEPELPNEILSRQEMRENPPHLLLTNYAMLEYLLLRPLDMDLFQSGADSKWRFIVVDEAHVYDGTQGAEIAMLLRRVRDRVAPNSSIQCIATSATVGGDSNPSAVTKFASNLFGEPFEWSSDDSARRDVVMAQRVQAPPGPYWGPLSAADYETLVNAPETGNAVLEAAREAGWVRADSAETTAATALSHEKSFAVMRETLADGPQTFDRVAAATFGRSHGSREGLAAMVDLASSLREADGTTPLSARYHLFLRATEGAFTCLSPSGPHVHLARHEICPDCDAPVFEIGSCKRCGAVHVHGTPTQEEGVLHLRPRKAMSKGIWLVLGDHDGLTDEDETASVDDGDDISADTAKLCTNCGALATQDAQTCAGCGNSDMRSVRKLKQRGEEIAGCLVCGARGAATVRVFETGSDASGAVITTALYQNLPVADSPHGATLPGEGRKLLAFSDSRQAAAYFAPYLEDSYSRLQRRRLISQGMIAAHADEEPVAVEDIIFKTRAKAQAVKHFPARMTAQQAGRVVAPWVMAEVLATDDRQSLEGLGLISISLFRDPHWPAPAPLLQLGLTEDEAWSFLQELVRTLRQQGAVTMPEDVPPNDEIFAPRLGPIRVRESGPEAIRKVLSWLPGRGTNRRVDYARRVLAALGREMDVEQLLKGVWSYLTRPETPVDWLTSSTETGLGRVYQLDHECLQLTWVNEDSPVFQCRVCRRVAPFSVRGVCPALGCDGALEEFVPPPPDEDRDHYRTLYRSMNAVPLKTKEHTAQWINTEAAKIQHEFVRGEINALSCSTTFELGVDVGELQAVMLRNMPPSTANYLQRAGRAGRRSGAAALVVTYAMRRSHDLTRFNEPEILISGQVRAPYVPLVNTRIDRRHAHSVALAAFFRWLFETTGRIDRKAGEFFLHQDGNEPSVDLVKTFLTPVPNDVTEALERILPTEVATELNLASEEWASVLIELIDRVRDELRTEVGTMKELEQKASDEGKHALAQRYQKVGNTLRKRDLLGFLANRNVLPKYGFPVDSVELRTNFGRGTTSGALLDLSRDLSQAIYEYAPEAEIVAGGHLWTSRGIYRLPGRELQEYLYQVCKRCGGFRYGIESAEQQCQHCGEVSQSAARTITIPEFGFVAAPDPEKPGPRPPRRSWSGAVHVLAEPPEARTYTVQMNGGTAAVSAGPRGRLIALADGPSKMGFWVCDWCGHGSPRVLNPQRPPKHSHLLKNQPCNGPQRLLDLGHVYETDLLSIDGNVFGYRATQSAWQSVMYAIVEAASETLEIAREDIGGSLTPAGADHWSITLFDAVPGGAGHVLQVEQNLSQVLAAALRRVSECECGPETSCYGCLRSYQNQRDHDNLSRGAAEQVLRRLINNGGEIDIPVHVEKVVVIPECLPRDWIGLYKDAFGTERDLLVALAEAGAPRPELGFESAGGVPISVAWPDRLIAAEIGLEPEDRDELGSEGWSVLPTADLLALLAGAVKAS